MWPYTSALLMLLTVSTLYWRIPFDSSVMWVILAGSHHYLVIPCCSAGRFMSPTSSCVREEIFYKRLRVKWQELKASSTGKRKMTCNLSWVSCKTTDRASPSNLHIKLCIAFYLVTDMTEARKMTMEFLLSSCISFQDLYFYQIWIWDCWMYFKISSVNEYYLMDSSMSVFLSTLLLEWPWITFL